MNKIGERIRKRRLELEMSVDTLAEKIDKDRATVYRYEKGDINNLPHAILVPLAKALNTTPAELMGFPVDKNTYYERFSPETANLEQLIRNDTKLSEALTEYFCLSDDEKQHVIDTIYLLRRKNG